MYSIDYSLSKVSADNSLKTITRFQIQYSEHVITLNVTWSEKKNIPHQMVPATRLINITKLICNSFNKDSNSR